MKHFLIILPIYLDKSKRISKTYLIFYKFFVIEDEKFNHDTFQYLFKTDS